MYVTDETGQQLLPGRVNTDEDRRYQFEKLDPDSDYEIEVVAVLLANVEPAFAQQRNDDKVSKTFHTSVYNHPLWEKISPSSRNL